MPKIIVKKKLRFDGSDLPSNQRRLDTNLSENDLTKPLRKTIFQRTLFIMEKYPETKGNDTLLHARYCWYFYGRAFGMPFKELLKLPAPETISRCRRKAKELGLVEYTPKTAGRRKQREEAMRYVMPAIKTTDDLDNIEPI